MNLHKKDWTTGLLVKRYEDYQGNVDGVLEGMAKLSKDYSERVNQEKGKTQEEVEILNVGKIDPRRHLENDVSELMASSIIQCLGTMVDTIFLSLYGLIHV